MKKFTIALLALFSLATSAFSLDVAMRDRLFAAVYEEHRCVEDQYYTQSVCSGEFLSGLTYNAEFRAYEVEFEFEPGFFLHAIAFLDGEVTVTYWQK